MRYITGLQNEHFKMWKKLQTVKGRRKENRFLVETKKLVADFFASGIALDCVIVEEGQEDSLEEVSRLLERFSSSQLKEDWKKQKIFVLPKSLFSQLSSMQTHDGIVACARGRLSILFAQYQGAMKRAILLDHMQDPGNLGAILRSAEAFGVQTVFLLDCVDVTNGKVLRASMGSCFRMQLVEVQKEELFFQEVSKKKISLVGADMQGEPFSRFSWKAEHLLAIGNEGQGLSESVRAHLVDSVSIPMKGQVESLNAAVSASILMAFIAAKESGQR